ncbi:MAG: proteasome subunit alpha, partial [Janibacter sp.]
DVTARALANAYAQTLGTVFTQDQKPYEVEIVVAEVGRTDTTDRIYRLTYDGSVSDEHGCVAVGGDSDRLNEALRSRWTPGLDLGGAFDLAADVLAAPSEGDESRPGMARDSLEIAVLERDRPRRCFRRLSGPIGSDG